MIQDRIKEFIDFKGITAYKFCKDLGFSMGYLDKKGAIGTDKYLKIINYYEDLSPEWLLTGKGSMLKQINESLSMVSEPPSEYQVAKKEKDLSTNINYKDLADSRLEIIELLKEKLEYQKKEFDELKKELTAKVDPASIPEHSK